MHPLVYCPVSYQQKTADVRQSQTLAYIHVREGPFEGLSSCISPSTHVCGSGGIISQG